ncbi:MAG: hypothetical protein PW843_12730 [Azospirillaceae bacterium]|nr:hypothetical protein [Azospirillaceae bacterium]
MTPSLTSLRSRLTVLSQRAGSGRWMALAGMVAVIAAPMLAPVPAWAQSRDMQDLLNRLSRLETDVQTLSRDVYRNGARPSGPVSGVPGAPGAGSAAAGELEVLKLQMETSDAAADRQV